LEKYGIDYEEVRKKESIKRAEAEKRGRQ